MRKYLVGLVLGIVLMITGTVYAVQSERQSLSEIADYMATLIAQHIDEANEWWHSAADNKITWEGATADAYETILSLTDPTADITLLLPTDAAATYALMTSSLSTNSTTAANSVFGESNKLSFEGTADTFEISITAADATADVLYKLSDDTAGTYGIIPSTLATNSTTAANSIYGGTGILYFEGSSANTFEVALTAANATADVIYTLPDEAAGTYGFVVTSLATNSLTAANSVFGGSNSINWEGTANTFETSLVATDPTADIIYTLPDEAAGTYGVVITSLATNSFTAANSVSMASNTINWEGTANTFELSLDASDPTADVIYRLTDDVAGTYAVMSSTLATNSTTAANSVYGASNALMFEGSSANTFEIGIISANATADVLYTLPDDTAATYGIVTSELATNSTTAANSISGVSNGLQFEGATANTYETKLTVVDPTADQVLTLLNGTGRVPLTVQVSTTHGLQEGTTTLIAGDSLTYTFPDTAGGTLEVLCGGTAAGTNGAKILTLYAGATVVSTLTSAAADTGDWKASFLVSVVAGGTVKVMSDLAFATQPQGLADTQTTAVDLSAVVKWTIYMDLANTADTISTEQCIWKLLY